jgi:hypothetical protein
MSGRGTLRTSRRFPLTAPKRIFGAEQGTLAGDPKPTSERKAITAGTCALADNPLGSLLGPAGSRHRHVAGGLDGSWLVRS